MLSFNVIFSSGYTDGKNTAIWQIINQKEKSNNKDMNKYDIYDWGFYEGYNYYLNLSKIFPNQKEYLAFVTKNEQFLNQQQNLTLLCYRELTSKKLIKRK